MTISGRSRLTPPPSFLQSFLFFELSFAFGMHLLYLHYKLAKGRGKALYGANLIMPLSYSVCSAIIGTQSAVQGKCLSELINMTANGEQAYSVSVDLQSTADMIIFVFLQVKINFCIPSVFSSLLCGSCPLPFGLFV